MQEIVKGNGQATGDETGRRDVGALEISDKQRRFFLDNGYLVLRGVLSAGELAALREGTDALLRRGAQGPLPDEPDYQYGTGHRSGQPILKRVEYVIDKLEACRRLLAHPFILRSVEKVVGADLIPTWDSMVVKMPNEGIVVPWHRDAGTEGVGDVPIFNVDFYLDEADLDTCLWVYPGSHQWPQEQVDAIVKAPGFATGAAVPVAMQPGDVIFHNILLLHGSPANSGGKLRRVLYYEFRTAEVELAKGPHTPDYIGRKQAMLRRCIRLRAATGTGGGEVPFRYSPPAELDPPVPMPEEAEEVARFRFAHEEFWRG